MYCFLIFNKGNNFGDFILPNRLVDSFKHPLKFAAKYSQCSKVLLYHRTTNS